MSTRSIRKHAFFICFFGFVIVSFLWKLIFMKSAFLGGDYLYQFYPWSKIYSEAIKNFIFPFWTRYFHCGFPLMAEGQIGGFYPLNIGMFFLLPFKIAYNYSVVLHFILAGVFTYFYSRKMGADEWGGALSALVFCFGSAYAGCFYNIVSARTLIWFPLVLFFFEKYFETRKLPYLIFSGVIFSMQLLAGFVQMAFYSVIFYVIYFVQGILSRGTFKIRDFIGGACFLLIAWILFIPQLLLSWQLSGFSSRSTATLGFALWGSFSPFNIMSLCFPYWVFHGTKFYIGIFSIFFLVAALMHFKTEIKIRQLAVILFISIFLGLGLYNPIYVFLLKLTHLYAFRNPSKFIFFGVFSASILSGIGLTRFFVTEKDNVRIKSARIATLSIGIIMATFLFSKMILYLLRDKIIEIGKWLVSNYIAGRSYHRYGISTYMERVNDFYQQLVDKSSFSNIFIVSSVALCVTALSFGVYIIKSAKIRSFAKFVAIAIIFIDLYIFSFYGTGFGGNIKPFESLNAEYGNMLGYVKSDKGLFRILPFGLTDKDGVFWAMPNANILENIDSVAAYTPLAEENYKEALSGLQVVDDSLGVKPPLDEALVSNHQLLRILNVKYIISKRRLSYSFLKEVNIEKGIFLYKLEDYLPRIFFTHDIYGDIKAEDADNFIIKEYRSGFAEARIRAPENGYIIFSENYYPGWKAYVDGKETPIKSIKGIVQAIEISKGDHEVCFKFNPKF